MDEEQNKIAEKKNEVDAEAIVKNSAFLHSRELIEEGDTVIVYINPQMMHSVCVTRGKTLNMKYGALRHEFLIGKRYGSQVQATAGYIYALRPSPDLWTRAMQRRTQIIYTPDIASILVLLELKPGSVVCESGTGSGSLSHAIATAIAPMGHLYTQDIDAGRVDAVRQDIAKHGLQNCVTVAHRNVYTEGFGAESMGKCDAVFLDVPEPWLALDHAITAMDRERNCRLVNFSPCIEQVQRVAALLAQRGFVQIQTVELIHQQMKVSPVVRECLSDLLPQQPLPSSEFAESGGREARPPKGKKRRFPFDRKEGAESGRDGEGVAKTLHPFPLEQPTHTGYLTSATLLALPSE